jgi:hypothetical protein
VKCFYGVVEIKRQAMKPDKKIAKSIVLAVLLAQCFMFPILVRAQDQPDGPMNFAVAVMLPGQSKTYIASSSRLPDIMLIALFAYESGKLNITISKTDTAEDLLLLMERGSGYPQFAYKFGNSPRTMSIDLNVWDSAAILIASALMVSPNEGPHKYSITISFN